MTARSRKRWKPLWRRIRFSVLNVIFSGLSRFPRSLGLSLFGTLGLLAFYGLPRPRRRVLENTRLIFPQWSRARRWAFARRVFRALGRNGFDFARMHRYSEDDLRQLVVLRGAAHLEAAHRMGRGVICIGAHLGCWELIPLRLRAAGYAMAVVYRRIRDPDLQAYVAVRRERWGVRAHERDTEARGMVRSLRRGSLLGVLIDQRTQVDSVSVPFLGHPAWTPSGPARLALRLGVPVIPMVLSMSAGGRHLLEIGPQLPLEGAPPKATEQELAALVRKNTERFNDTLGKMILRRKEQWVWFHQRWRES
jgi:KDO2-lipid IV(A) lauroyltransferase